MEIIAHYDDEDNYIGYTFEGDLEPEIEVAQELLDDCEFADIDNENIIFLTLEGNVVYTLINYSWTEKLYTIKLKEDCRG